MIEMTEIWRPVRGWEGLYEVSNLGAVRSLDRVVFKSDGRVAHYRGRVLKGSPSAHGYLRVGLTESSTDRSEIVLVHQLVARAFVEGEQAGLHVLHWDDNETNNVWTNLRWGTHADNMNDIVRNGNHHHAVKTHCPQGHEYTKANTYVTPTRPKARYCRACQAVHRRASMDKKARGQHQ